jgi:hypothetical protein
MSILFGAVLLLGLVLGNYYWWRAAQHLAEGVAWFRLYFISKLFAGREQFTAEGWRYRNRAAAMFVFIILWVLVAGPLLLRE